MLLVLGLSICLASIGPGESRQLGSLNHQHTCVVERQSPLVAPVLERQNLVQRRVGMNAIEARREPAHFVIVVDRPKPEFTSGMAQNRPLPLYYQGDLEFDRGVAARKSHPEAIRREKI